MHPKNITERRGPKYGIPAVLYNTEKQSRSGWIWINSLTQYSKIRCWLHSNAIQIIKTIQRKGLKVLGLFPKEAILVWSQTVIYCYQIWLSGRYWVLITIPWKSASFTSSQERAMTRGFVSCFFLDTALLPPTFTKRWFKCQPTSVTIVWQVHCIKTKISKWHKIAINVTKMWK